MSLLAKVKNVLSTLQTNGLSIAEFLSAVSWGDNECTLDNDVRGARTRFLHSAEFPRLLATWYSPPSSKRGKQRTQGARDILRKFAINCVKGVFEEEIKQLSRHVKISGKISAKTLLSTTFETIAQDIKGPDGAPTLYSLLYAAAESKKDETQKDPEKMLTAILCMLAYHNSSRNCRFQQLLAIFWKSCGLASKAVDVLHACGLSMCDTWTRDAISSLDEGNFKAIAMVVEFVKAFAFIVVHDNLNIPFRVSSQRIDHKNSFENGTASTVICLPPSAKPILDNKAEYARMANWRALRDRPLIDYSTIFKKHVQSMEYVNQSYKHHILQFVLSCPAFEKYAHRDDPLLAPPAPRRQLPCGRDHRTIQMPLGTVPIDESTYEGNSEVVKELLRQMGLSSVEERKRLATSRLIPWIGDQKTQVLLKGLQNMRASDDNGFDRMDWLIPMFGWFHVLMMISKQIFWVHKGSNKQTNPNYYDLKEIILHLLEAHILCCWLQVSGFQTLEGLAASNPSPAELSVYADKILNRYVTARAAHRSRNLPKDKKSQQDQVFVNACAFIRDGLTFYELLSSIREGDVGRMADLIPQLTIMCIGNGNGNYATEFLDLMQRMDNVWSPELK
ncbi:hypothetical protein BOTBODRAFT_173296 [Botryobasidium botryosum FD-172 SS1]|uniref:DUF6589 domain-containing protein n=1 Tax=Botryobasidium botryosum (strain FD-172 SS1) TaxID=930990 RepID=A0A067MVU3_BOTB1|nr:hypothetical protein BOTBODRAFT_173296 [Botryobasidium botryosum FD-172 SS1]